VLVEWLFVWPGLGRLLAQVLLSPSSASPGALFGGGQYFLNPPLLAALLTILALAFLIVDGVASGLARAVDPRLRQAETDQLKT
jgi:ABC-type dipeptide/oligopeptide/nickel transport system permease component